MWLAVPNMSDRHVGTPYVIPWQHRGLPQCALLHTFTVGCMGCLCRVWQCVCLLTPAKDFRGRCSDDRAVLELFQKALKELECVMERECACVWCSVGVYLDWLIGWVWLCMDVGVGVAEITFLTCTSAISSWCVTCVPTFIACSTVELGGVCELHQEMGQQTEELLREIEYLKSELTGEFYVCIYV